MKEHSSEKNTGYKRKTSHQTIVRILIPTKKNEKEIKYMGEGHKKASFRMMKSVKSYYFVVITRHIWY